MKMLMMCLVLTTACSTSFIHQTPTANTYPQARPVDFQFLPRATAKSCNTDESFDQKKLVDLAKIGMMDEVAEADGLMNCHIIGKYNTANGYGICVSVSCRPFKLVSTSNTKDVHPTSEATGDGILHPGQ